MKKIFTIAVALTAAATICAQTTYKAQIILKNGQTQEYNVEDIQEITFSKSGQEQLPVSFTVPTDFSQSYVLKIMAYGKQVAEVDKEYIKGNDQVTVVYPCDENGTADLTKGIITSTGATVAWTAAATAPTVGEAATPVTKFYIVDGQLATTYDGETTEATVVPDVLSDRRGTELETYRIVKIGTKYWMADNLRATKFTDGTDIASFSETQTADWNANTTGAYLLTSDADWTEIAGLFYNGYVAVSDKIAPEGWHVPTCADYTDIRQSIGARTAALYRDNLPGSWADGTAANNYTGFSVVATGYFSSATGVASMFSDTYIWTSDSQYDALARADAIDFFRLTSTGTNAVFPTKGLNPHSYNFGHCIRLVRN